MAEEGLAWPPPGLPSDARIFQLKSNSKEPPPGFRGAHHRARPVEQALIVVCPKFSYAIALDDQFALVDLDKTSEQARAAFDALPETWQQATWSGGLHKLFRVPKDFVGHNVKWRLPDGTPIGDLKNHGYCVGPGSVVHDHQYCLLNACDPAPAPPEILEQLATAPEFLEPDERNTIPVGERDIWMTSLAGFLRRRGLSETAMAQILYATAKSPVIEQPVGAEWTLSDAKRVAKSIAHKAPEEALGPLMPAALECGTDVRLVGPPQKWLMNGFVPRGELVMCYGDGGAGKSSWGSWLTAQATNKGLRCLFAGVEEPFRRFLLRVVQSGGNRHLVYSVPHASRLTFPRYADDLEEAITLLGLGFCYIDSIYTHFSPDDRGNAAERARRVLGCLAEISQRTGATILAVFHENKTGEWSGSAEMRNVGRVMLHAQRDQDSDEPMTLLVKKTNLKKATTVATFVGREVPAIDPETGQAQMEEDDSGKLVPSQIVVVERGEDKPIGAKGKGKSTKVRGKINLADIEVGD